VAHKLRKSDIIVNYNLKNMPQLIGIWLTNPKKPYTTQIYTDKTFCVMFARHHNGDQKNWRNSLIFCENLSSLMTQLRFQGSSMPSVNNL
jgi:hypothetical protein